MAELDQDVVRLAKAIRQVETGNRPIKGASGELSSRYQYMPATWKATAKKYLGNENAELTLENENKATYLKIKDWKDSGYGPDQIASMWNSGQPDWEGKVGVNKAGVKYDVPSYVSKVGAEYKKLKSSEKSAFKPIPYTPPPQASQQRQADYAAAEENNAIFAPNTENPSATSEAFKTIGNMPTSAFGFVKGAIDLINPVTTFNNIKEAVNIFGDIREQNKRTGEIKQQKADTENELIRRYNQKLAAGEDVTKLEDFFRTQGIDPKQIRTAAPAPSTAKQIFSSTPEAVYQTLVPEAAKGVIQAGGGYITGNEANIDEGLDRAQRAIVTDPVGSVAPFLIGGKYAAEKFGKGAQFDAAVSKTARPIIKPFEAIGNKISETARFGASQATGLQPATIGEILRNPEKFSAKSRSAIDRVSLGREVQSSLGKRLEALKETGKLYEPIRQSPEVVNVSKNWLIDTIKAETGLELVNGKFKSSPSAKIRANSDVRAIQQLYDTYNSTFKKGQMTPNEFLNFRSDLAELAKFERQIGKSKPVETITKSTRAKFNKAYREQIKGLKELDELYGPEVGEIKKLSKGIVNKEGQLTDAAINKIANATGKGKDFLLSRLEEASPGITQKIKVLKAVEDIQNASGIKVGTYSRTGLIAGAGLGFGVLEGIITAILTSPEIAVPLLRQAGLLKNSAVVRQILQVLDRINRLPENTPIIIDENIKTPKKVGAFSPKEMTTKQKSAPPPQVLDKAGKRLGMTEENFYKAQEAGEIPKNVYPQIKEGGRVEFNNPIFGEKPTANTIIPSSQVLDKFLKPAPKTTYHGTTAANAESIIKSGFDISKNTKGYAESPYAMFTSRKVFGGNDHVARTYGKNILKVSPKKGVDIKMLNQDGWYETFGRSKGIKDSTQIAEQLKKQGYDMVEDPSGEYIILKPSKFNITN